MYLRTILLSCIWVLLVFLALFGWSTYRYYEIVHADDPIDPTLVATTWMSKVVRGDLTYELSENEALELESKDIIETGLESKASITWPDKSITRLGPKTRIVIERMYASRDYESIEIAYNLEKGKVWNTVIRTLVGDSYFRVLLPRESVVAWVRGTVFEINLENKYIRAINHSTLLTQNKKQLVLLPGELVDSENIVLKKGKEWIDATWNEWNESADMIYEWLQKLEIDARIKRLTEDIGKYNIGNATRKILETLPGFEDITIAEYLETNQIQNLKNISSESLIAYYQKLGNLSSWENKITLRDALLSRESSTIAKIRESLELHAFWESLDSGNLTEWAKDYLKRNWLNVDEFSSKFINGAKNDIHTFGETLSGWLNRLGF